MFCSAALASQCIPLVSLRCFIGVFGAFCATAGRVLALTAYCCLAEEMLLPPLCLRSNSARASASGLLGSILCDEVTATVGVAVAAGFLGVGLGAGVAGCGFTSGTIVI